LPSPEHTRGSQPTATRRRTRLWLVAAAAALLATAAVVVMVLSRASKMETGLRAALHHAPAGATFVAYTDWSAFGHPDGYDIPVRLRTDGAAGDAPPARQRPATRRRRLLQRHPSARRLAGLA
jgi:hypothetical protein